MKSLFLAVTGFVFLSGCHSIRYPLSAKLMPDAGVNTGTDMISEENPDAQIELRMTVASETRTGYGVGPQTCLLVKYAPGEKWQYMYSPIKGFVHESGYEYELLVLRSELRNPPQDASRYVYRLKKIVSKVKKLSEGMPKEK